MMTRDTIRKQRGAILALAEQYGATNVRLFGSVARDEATESSDVDLLVDVTQDWSLLDHIGFQQDIEDLLGTHVDVVIAANVREGFRTRILDEAVDL